MSLSLTPSKRQHNRNPKESNGKKIQKIGHHDKRKQTDKVSSRTAVFRVLCPSSIIGSVIGEGGSILSQIRQETGAKVRVDDSVPGCDERVIYIMGGENEAENTSEESKNDNEDDKLPKEQTNPEDNIENSVEKKVHPTAEDSQFGRGASSVQKALLLVFENFLRAECETEGGNEGKSQSASVTSRLLVLTSQVGCLLGRGGSVIKQISAESGAQIRVLPRDKLPQCASSTDELVQITGAADAVKRAIKAISEKIMENPPRDLDSLPSTPSVPPSLSQIHPLRKHESRSNRSLAAPHGHAFRDHTDFPSSVPSLFPNFHERIMPGRMDVSDFLTFRLLCPDERVGGVIGKGGAIIKTLQHETGCEIKVLESTSDGVDRIIVISGRAHPDDRISAIQDAVLRVQNRIAKASPDNNEKGVTARLLISSNQIGCLLGKGGSVIAEMRKVTGAYIRILGKDQIPKCASENEEVVQINGEPEVVQEAVLQITTRLQHHFFRDAFPSFNHPPSHAFADRAPPLPSFPGRRELTPPGTFPKFGPSFQNFDSVGALPPRGGFLPHDDHPPFMHDMHRQGMPQLSERAWHPQNMVEGGKMGLLDYPGASQRRMSGFGGESQQAVITNTVVEVVVPSSLIPSIRGEGGGCLRQIRQISDAKINITDPKPGAAETVIIISGTPEETNAAQSLIQAFVMVENESPRL